MYYIAKPDTDPCYILSSSSVVNREEVFKREKKGLLRSLMCHNSKRRKKLRQTFFYSLILAVLKDTKFELDFLFLSLSRLCYQYNTYNILCTLLITGLLERLITSNLDMSMYSTLNLV